ncbi:MAG: cupin domain-containing protein [Bacteroidota bacterium]
MRNPKLVSLKDEASPIAIGGRHIILDSETTDGDIYLVKGIMPKGSSVPVHVHEREDEIFHVLAGEVELILGDETLTGKAGDIIYLPRGVKHGIKTAGSATAKVLNYVIPRKNFEDFFNEMRLMKTSPTSAETVTLAKKYGITFL